MKEKIRKFADEQWGTEGLKDLSEFNIPLESAIGMIEKFISDNKMVSIDTPEGAKAYLKSEGVDMTGVVEKATKELNERKENHKA